MKGFKVVIIIFVFLIIGLVLFNRWMNKEVNLLVESSSQNTNLQQENIPKVTPNSVKKPGTVKIDPANDPLAPRTQKVLKKEDKEKPKTTPQKVLEPAMDDPEFLVN